MWNRHINGSHRCPLRVKENKFRDSIGIYKRGDNRHINGPHRCPLHMKEGKFRDPIGIYKRGDRSITQDNKILRN